MKMILTVLLLALACLPAFAQEPTPSDKAQDEVLALDQHRQDVKIEAVADEVDADGNASATQQAENTASIKSSDARITANEKLTSAQSFTIQILTIVMPLLTLLATAGIGIMQIKARNEREKQAQEQRASLAAMATSINGVKSELVAATQARAFYEARTLELERQLDPAKAAKLEERTAEIMAETKAASIAAATTADAVSVQLSSEAGVPHPPIPPAKGET